MQFFLVDMLYKINLENMSTVMMKIKLREILRNLFLGQQ